MERVAAGSFLGSSGCGGSAGPGIGAFGDNTAVARRLRTGIVRLNSSAWDGAAPFGVYKQSGNGREYGKFGLQEFTDIKGIVGFGD